MSAALSSTAHGSPSVPSQTGHPTLIAAREMEILLIKGAKMMANLGSASPGGLDPGEQRQHERVWKEAPVRVRTPAKHDADDAAEVSGSDEEGAIDAHEVNKIVEKFHSLYSPDTPTPRASDAPHAPHAHPSSHPGTRGEAAAAHSVEADDTVHLVVDAADVARGQDGPGGGDSARHKRVQEVQARALKQQQLERQRFLLNLDPGSWQRQADEGYFQQGEDDLMAAAAEEKAVHGVSDRHCELLHALGALLDSRSNVDQTGQRHLISFRSALFLEQSIQARRERASLAAGVDAAEELRMTDSMILKAQSLCNFALDGHITSPHLASPEPHFAFPHLTSPHHTSPCPHVTTLTSLARPNLTCPRLDLPSPHFALTSPDLTWPEQCLT